MKAADMRASPSLFGRSNLPIRYLHGCWLLAKGDAGLDTSTGPTKQRGPHICKSPKLRFCRQAPVWRIPWTPEWTPPEVLEAQQKPRVAVIR